MQMLRGQLRALIAQLVLIAQVRHRVRFLALVLNTAWDAPLSALDVRLGIGVRPIISNLSLVLLVHSAKAIVPHAHLAAPAMHVHHHNHHQQWLVYQARTLWVRRIRARDAPLGTCVPTPLKLP